MRKGELKEYEDDTSSLNDLEFLMIRRKDSLGYVEFLRGRYALSDVDFIHSIFEEMTIDERERISMMKFDDL